MRTVNAILITLLTVVKVFITNPVGFGRKRKPQEKRGQKVNNNNK